MTITAVILLLVILIGTYFIFKLIRPQDSQGQANSHESQAPKIKANRYARAQKKSQDKKLGNNPLEDVGKSKQPAPQIDSDSALGLTDEPTALDASTMAAKQHAAKQADTNVPDFTVMHLVAAKNRPYSGYELLQALLSLGLRYGDMNIFHRHEQKTGRGDILFSLASATEAGTFDLAKMGAFNCYGLTLFLKIKKVKEPLVAYELMLDTAGQLVEDLGGTVLDENRAPMTKHTVVQQRKMIREFEKVAHTPDMFVES